jgi:hypothetical protein
MKEIDEPQMSFKNEQNSLFSQTMQWHSTSKDDSMIGNLNKDFGKKVSIDFGVKGDY